MSRARSWAAAPRSRRCAAGSNPATGSIILIASIAGLKPIMQTTTYGTAKAAMIAMAAALGQEMQAAGDAIRVNAICPGGTRTAMTEEAFGGDEYWDRPDSFAKLPLEGLCPRR